MNNDTKALPIILIHKGAKNLSLPFVLSQVKLFNPESRIIFIGDETNKKYNKYVEHFLIEDYLEEGELLKKYYKHFSPNPHEFELFCLQRWFVLLNFVKKNKIKKCFYMDSDVMVYSDLSKESANFSQCDMTVNSRFFGHCMFVNNSDALQDFCNFILKTYEEKSLPEIKTDFNDYLEMVKKEKGGISDMTFLNKYYKMHEDKVCDTNIIIGNSTFDNNVNDPNGFIVDNRGITRGIKRINMVKGIPYGTEKGTLRKIRFNVIHFQGPAKKYIPFFYSNRNTEFLGESLIAGGKFFFKKFFNY
jgi:hypothetical protein